MVVDQEGDPQRNGGMKLMPPGDLLHGSRMPKTDSDGKTMLRPSSNMWIEANLPYMRPSFRSSQRGYCDAPSVLQTSALH